MSSYHPHPALSLQGLAITHIYPSPPRGIYSKLNNRKSMNIEYPPAVQRVL